MIPENQSENTRTGFLRNPTRILIAVGIVALLCLLLPATAATDLDHWRPTATGTVEPVNTSIFSTFAQKMAPNGGGPPDIEGILNEAVRPFTDQIGAFFYVILFGVPYLILGMKQKNLSVPSLIGILFGAWMLVKVPAAYTMPAVALLALIVTGGLYGLYGKRP